MKKRVVTALAITVALSLGACQEDPVMDELTEDKELNQFSEPDNHREREGDPWGNDDDNDDEGYGG